ncbi:hypothetical protein [Rhizobium ruizarguesonis]|uniref:hypothetical protein n=1 Tax=Rhizobium ruizarguesonis TaxID=2081791 RepID=UPI0010302221|nr:hypothetical protein [Rhizobium ruizarguesonis]MBY5850585.1 hypothetical protein [Rhizobium leguminosarum]MBY5891418.1 hypothetical protein [Rhizobium leguminosarum]QSY99604.1 hypothetical protein J3P73_17380 [Rhizobium ruizarguesonis]TAT79532.1 hypothetical protein ELI56_15635 [Rhizobium ruizarguesonis]TAT89515.1 hypothetical protein ELI54_15550 [Rhizobium ruizarguesonis]
MIDLNEKKAFDLTALADEFERRKNAGDNRFEKYRVLIEEFEAAASILRDLRAAEASLRTLEAIQLTPEMRVDFAQALFTHAVLCYCRATVSETNARRRINVDTKAFTPEQFKKHLDIKNLRSTAMAHYHKGLGKHGDIWVHDKVAMRPVDGRLSSIDIFKRTNYRADAAHDLFELLTVAISYVSSERMRRKTSLDEAIAVAITKDEAFVERLKAHSFDPDVFFQGLGKPPDEFWQDIYVTGETLTPPDS